MPEVKPVKRGRGRPPGAKNKPKLIVREEPKKAVVDVGINALHPAPRIAKEIRRLADATGFTLKRIFDDILESGTIEVQTMYLEVINARRDIQRALDALDGKITAKRSTGAGPEPKAPVRNGEPARALRNETRNPRPPEPGPQEPESPSEQPDITFEQRGLATPPRAHPQSPPSTGVDPDFAGFEDPTVVETEPEVEPEESEEEMEEAQVERDN